MRYFIFLFLMQIVFFNEAYAYLPVIDYSVLMRLSTQISLLKKETNYIEATLKKLRSSQYQWENSQILINRLGNILEDKTDLAYSTKNADKKFSKLYPGYRSSKNYLSQYRKRVNMTLKTLAVFLKTLGLSADDFSDENKRLIFFQKQVQQSKGQTQAIQASAQIASEFVSQLQLLRQIIIAQSNAQAAYYAENIQNEASARIALSDVIHAGSTAVPAYGSSEDHLEIV